MGLSRAAGKYVSDDSCGGSDGCGSDSGGGDCGVGGGTKK